MLRNPSQVWLFGTNKARRWLCTVMATESTPIMSGSRSRIRVTGSKESSTLYHKLTALDSSNGSVVQFLDDWVLKQRKFLHRYDILGFIDEFRKYKQFNHALQLLDWMEMRGMRLSFGEHAKRIDLLWRTGGIVAAEKYFTDLPIPAKNVFTYGTLLNCFCNEKMTEKAMALLEEMKKLKMELNSFLYSSLMVLHMKLGEPEKVQALAEDMKEKNIAPHIFTYNLLMSSYASLNDIEGVERVFKEVEGGSKVMPEWDFYCNLAGIYVGAGLFEKADS
ncbi:Pentatricopeptide repeat [Macleaya cordata]|uniref:Pentatricopeptide repeat n=1 Tax=Macleaya cordata TaxID=56857 RepID=A0A200R291_MACCD|nr:Pentatricopeptide repeat [Macleaya cordata]